MSEAEFRGSASARLLRSGIHGRPVGFRPKRSTRSRPDGFRFRFGVKGFRGGHEGSFLRALLLLRLYGIGFRVSG